ncbi:MAG: 30S ribosomal protein S5 [Chloroflexi bacterium RBG_13_53_26]|jgi:small subunit ribosomal protein S5|nr:MAG: 30S ribosomal protein S5 [Chloroflexi bacterium RBG_13_53_26]
MIREEVVEAKEELSEKVVSVTRVAKVVKGGKHLRFRALVAIGDGRGQVGIGIGKANEVAQAIQKAGTVARKGMITVALAGTTIPHEIRAKYGAADVLLKPASPGSGVIAGGSMRAVVEAAGIKDVLAKSLGTSNPTNVVKATMVALSRLREPEKVLAERKAASTARG